MLRLRTATGLSVLALLLGVAGTSWLSTLTDRGFVAASRNALAHAPATTPRSPARRRSSPPSHRTVMRAQPAVREPAAYRALPDSVPDSSAAALAETNSELVPLTTPTDTSLSWEQLRGHLDGRVQLQVDVDGSGRVSAASVAQSSGDELLDAHALRSVRGWRFAVPEANAAGLHGEVTVRYSSANGAL